eukprot:SM000128S26197  [mRNA]  locus=s128:34272:36480:- [translate_table: standard]
MALAAPAAAAAAAAAGPSPAVVLLPALSDVSTVEEWEAVGRGLAASAVALDWPGFGLSDRPPLDYTADALEQFLADALRPGAGLLPPAVGGAAPVVVGAGHAAALAIRAAAKGLLKPRAIVAVAPTWGGPLPIVFGNSPKMQGRYALLRNALRLPGLGWALYNFGLATPRNVESQYRSHVYGSKSNVTPELISKRVTLTQQPGARFAPAAFISGRLDPAQSREEFLQQVANVGVPLLVVSSRNSPRRSKGEMEALRDSPGVSHFCEVNGALLAHEEYAQEVTDAIAKFLAQLLGRGAAENGQIGEVLRSSSDAILKISYEGRRHCAQLSACLTSQILQCAHVLISLHASIVMGL